MMHSVWIGSNRTELYTKIIKKFGKISGMVRCEKIQFHCISKESNFFFGSKIRKKFLTLGNLNLKILDSVLKGIYLEYLIQLMSR
jgi:hypothetical protein